MAWEGRYLADQLYDLGQVLLLLQDLLGLGAQWHELGEVLVVVVVQRARVLAVADQPVDRGEVLPLGQLLVQTPEHLAAAGDEEDHTESNVSRDFTSLAMIIIIIVIEIIP